MKKTVTICDFCNEIISPEENSGFLISKRQVTKEIRLDLCFECAKEEEKRLRRKIDCQDDC